MPFSTYELSDLKAADGADAWTWEGRTLVGYISADNYDNIIPLGGELTVGTERADLKGAWNLNKLNFSVYIDGAGSDTYIDVITETHPYYKAYSSYNCRPLTDAIVRNETSVYSSGEVVRYWYNSRISCAIHPGENRTISAVWYSDYPTSNSDFINHGDVSSLTIPYSHLYNL